MHQDVADDMSANEERPFANRLPDTARKVDHDLCEIDDRVDWLQALSPLDTHGLWEEFRRSGFRTVPEYRYPDADPELPALRRRLLALPVEKVEPKEVQALLREKQRELDRQIELVELRGTSGFLPASIDLWGDAELELVDCARDVLRGFGDTGESGEPAGCREVLEEAERQIRAYRERDPRFATDVHVVDDLAAKLMVSRGDLYVARDICVDSAQVAPLVHHEVGAHALTRHNGSLQPLVQLECGLAHYHSLQEGLGVLSEYLSGHLAPARLRVLACRVTATHRICEGGTVAEVFHELVGAYGMAEGEAFNIALRVGRGSGMTKDAAYLRGLRDLLEYLRHGGSLEFLFVGKFALAHVHTLHDLKQAGYLQPPALLPLYLEQEEALIRLERCRTASVFDLVEEK